MSNTNCPADDGVGLGDACCDALDVCFCEADAVRDALGEGGSEVETVVERDWLAVDPLAVTLRVPVVVLVAEIDSVRVCVRVYEVLMVCDCVAEKLGLDEELLVEEGVRLCDAVSDADAELEPDCEGLSVMVGDVDGVFALERVRLEVAAWL